MKDDKEEIQRADMFRMFKTGMDIMGDADSALYTELSLMAQVYDMMYAGARNIGLLPSPIVQDKERNRWGLPPGEDGAAEENSFLQKLPKDGLWHSCAHMLEDSDVGAPIVRMHEEVPQPTPSLLVCTQIPREWVQLSATKGRP